MYSITSSKYNVLANVVQAKNYSCVMECIYLVISCLFELAVGKKLYVKFFIKSAEIIAETIFHIRMILKFAGHYL